CEIPEKSELERRLENALSQLPRSYVATNTGSIQLIPNFFFLGNTTVQGLTDLRADKPYKTFCRGNDRVTVFSIRSWSPIRIAILWRLSSGQNGAIRAHAVHLRYKGVTITNCAGGGTTSRIELLMPLQPITFTSGWTGLVRP
ncbi:unnamed protein product, partial [Ixodes hexagonus]